MDRAVAERVIRTAMRVAETGHGDLRLLRQPLTGYRLRAGDSRLRVELDEAEATMLVIRVLHRTRAYRED